MKKEAAHDLRGIGQERRKGLRAATEVTFIYFYFFWVNFKILEQFLIYRKIIKIAQSTHIHPVSHIINTLWYIWGGNLLSLDASCSPDWACRLDVLIHQLLSSSQMDRPVPTLEERKPSP